MTVYLAYATTGKEFAVTEKLEELGFSVWCGRCIEFKRRGKKRRPEPMETPKLPNYLFLSLSDADWHRLRQSEVKHLAQTLYPLSRGDTRALANFKLAVEGAYEEGQRIARNNDIAQIAEYKRGQALIDLSGKLGEVTLRFRKMVERAHELHPKIEAEMEMMGRWVKVELDPLDTKAAE